MPTDDNPKWPLPDYYTTGGLTSYSNIILSPTPTPPIKSITLTKTSEISAHSFARHIRGLYGLYVLGILEVEDMLKKELKSSHKRAIIL